MSDQEQPDGVNNPEEEQPKNAKGRASSNKKNISKSPEAKQKQSENSGMQRPKSAADRKGPKLPAKFKETREMAIRREFQIGLNKITYNETREIGMSEIQNIISNSRSPQDLRVYISALCDQPRNLNSATKEMEVLIFGIIASVYKEDLFDPIDKPPNLIKSVVRLCEAVHAYFKDTSSGVQSACARVLNEIYSNCIKQQPADTVKLIIAEPLLSILNGGADKATQQTAAICLCEFASLLTRQGRKDVIDEMCEKIYTIFLKTNHDFIELMRVIGICMASNNLAKVSDKLSGIINKLCAIASSNCQLNQYYLNKMEACNTLGIIGKILAIPDVQVNSDLKRIYDKVSDVLKDISKNKILRLQKAGASALKIWEILLRTDAPIPNEDADKILLPEEEEALKVENELKSRPPPEKFEMPSRNNFREARDQFKKEKQGNQEDKEQKIEDFIKDAQLKHNRGQNYVRARSGTGGGYVAWSPPPKDGKVAKEKAYANQKKNLKEQIFQQHLNRPKTAAVDKFSYLPEDIWPKKPTKDEVLDTEGIKAERDQTPEKNDEERNKTPEKKEGVEAEDAKTAEPNVEKKPSQEKKLQRPQTAAAKTTQDADGRPKSREGPSAIRGKQTKKEPKSAQKATEDAEKKQSEVPEPKSSDGVRESSNLRSKNKKSTKDEKFIVSAEDAAEGKTLSETNSEKRIGLRKSTKKSSNKDLNASDSSSKTPRKLQRLHTPESIQDDCFKDVKLQTQNNKIDSASKIVTTQNSEKDLLNSEQLDQQEQPSEQVEKISIQANSHREQAAAIRQPKPMARRNVQPPQNKPQQEKEMTDQEIEELLNKADKNLSLVKEKEKQEAEEALKRKNDELLKQKAREEYKKPPPKPFDQSPSYKLFEADVPIEKAVDYVVDSTLRTENNEIEGGHHAGGERGSYRTPQKKEIQQHLPENQEENNTDEVKNEQHAAIDDPALFGIAKGNRNFAQNNILPQRKARGRAKASHSENVEPVVNKTLVVEEEENHEGKKWESPVRQEDTMEAFQREEMDVGTQAVNQTHPEPKQQAKTAQDTKMKPVSEEKEEARVVKKPAKKISPPPYKQTNASDERPISGSKTGYSLPIEAYQYEEALDEILTGLQRVSAFQAQVTGQAGTQEINHPLPQRGNPNQSKVVENQAQNSMVQPFHGEDSKFNPLNSQVLNNVSDMKSIQKTKADSTNQQSVVVQKPSTNIRPPQNFDDSLEVSRPGPISQSNVKPQGQAVQDSTLKDSKQINPRLPNSQQFDLKDSSDQDYVTKKPASKIIPPPNQQQIGTNQSKNTYALDERPISGSKMGYSLPLEAFQNEDGLDNELADSLGTFHRAGDSQYRNPSEVKYSADERPLQNSRIRQPLPQEAYQNEEAIDEMLSDPQYQLDVIRESPEHTIPRDSREVRSSDQNIFRMEDSHQQLPSEVFSKHVDNVIQRTGVRQPQNPSPDISVGGHIEPIHEMLGLEDIIRDQIKIQLQKMIPSKHEGKDTSPSAKANRSGTQITKSPESRGTEKSSPNFKPEEPSEQGQQSVFDPPMIGHGVHQKSVSAVSSSMPEKKLAQDQNKVISTTLQVPESTLKTNNYDPTQGVKQTAIQNVHTNQRDREDQVMNRKLKPEELGNVGYSTIGERRISGSNWQTPTAQNIKEVPNKGKIQANKTIQMEMDTIGYGSTEEDEIIQPPQYQTSQPIQYQPQQPQKLNYYNHVKDRALNGNYIEQKPLSEPIRQEPIKRPVEKQLERVEEPLRTSHQVPRANPQKPAEIDWKPSREKSQESVSTLEQWQMALSLIEEGKYETAYSNILESGDDIYLLRLMKITGPCLKHLSRATAMKLMSRLTLLMGSDFMSKLGVGFFENAQNNGLIKSLQIGQQQELMKIVRDISLKQTPLGVRSSKLALKIENDFKNI